MRLVVEIDLVKGASSVTQKSTTSAGAQVSNEPVGTGVGFRGYHVAGVAGQWPSINDGTYKAYGSGGYPGWISKSLSAADGSIDITWSLVFDAPTDVLVVSFDRVCQEWATQAVVTVGRQTQQLVNSSWKMFIQLNGATECSIQFTKWNKAFKNVKITQFSTETTETFSGPTITSASYSEQVWNAQFEISTGFVEQYADIEFRDVYNVLHAAADSNLLMDNARVRIYTIDENGTKQLAGTYLSDTWSVSGDSDEVSLACNDDSRSFDKYVLDVVQQNKSVAEILNSIFAAIPGVTFTIPADLATYLNSCICADIYFRDTSAQEILDELCDRWMLRLYWDAREETFVVTEAL